jgi:hypothetical protein
MSKASRRDDDDLRPEYDFASMKGGVRGKYVARLRKGSNLALLEPDIAAAFPSDGAVNEAHRAQHDEGGPRKVRAAEQGASSAEPRSFPCEEGKAGRRGSRRSAAWLSPR